MIKKNKTKQSKIYKRSNRTTGLGDAINKAIDPIIQKRGFANRDIIANWPIFAPSPYNQVSIPDRLVWPRGEKSDQGATLYLRCAPAHALALSHEGAKIAASVNRYFGYILVNRVKLSLEPFSPHSSKMLDKGQTPTKETIKAVNEEIKDIKDDDLKEALRRLGLNIKTK